MRSKLKDLSRVSARIFNGPGNNTVLSNASWVQVSLPGVDWTTVPGMAQPDKLVIPEDGLYLVSATVQFNTAPTSWKLLRVGIGSGTSNRGVTFVGGPASSSDNAGGPSYSEPMALRKGDVLTLYVNQNASGTLYGASLSAVRI